MTGGLNQVSPCNQTKGAAHTSLSATNKSSAEGDNGGRGRLESGRVVLEGNGHHSRLLRVIPSHVMVVFFQNVKNCGWQPPACLDPLMR